MTGNGCGHDKKHPALDVKLKHIPLSLINKITKCIRNYYKYPGCLPTLNNANRDKKITDRQMRSCRRESTIRVLCALIHHTELATMRVGIPTHDGFKPIGVRFFVKLTGLSQSRFERALSDLNAAGLITTSERYRIDNNEFVGLNAVRTISTQLFAIFGLAKKLKSKRDEKSGELRDRRDQLSINALANMTMTLKASKRKKRARKSKNTVTERSTDPPGPDLTIKQHLQSLKLAIS